MKSIPVVRAEAEMRELTGRWRRKGLTIGLVPTMGALHRGHLSLVELALRRARRVVVSVFVNPAQFGPGEDLDNYPRDLEGDTVLVAEAGGHAVFSPPPEEIYPPEHSTKVVVNNLTGTLCGAYRPGHFDGVTTVCSILFGIVGPDLAVFGRKDAQQLAVIRRMVRDLHMNVEIVQGDIVRENDGLAMSSRNAYLDPGERRDAALIHRAMLAAEEAVKGGERNAERIISMVSAIIESSPLARVQYVSLVDPHSLQPVPALNPTGLLAVAVYFGGTRLIDNTILTSGSQEED